jgi:hypothetical protein
MNDYEKWTRLEQLYDKLAAQTLSEAERHEAMAICRDLGLDHDWDVFAHAPSTKEDPWREPPARPVRTSKKRQHP